jgi:hypothetical protein
MLKREGKIGDDFVEKLMGWATAASMAMRETTKLETTGKAINHWHTICGALLAEENSTYLKSQAIWWGGLA